MYLCLVLVFIVTLVLCVASYFLYPALVTMLGWLFAFKSTSRDQEPMVSVIIAAYNEQRDIQRKIDNTLALDYPKDRMEILVGSDGSTDATADLLLPYSNQGIRCLVFTENRGKTAVQNDLAAQAVGEVLVFTDAASFLPADALRKLVRHFGDPRIGCVAGRMVFVQTGENLTTQSQGLYWRYESFIRRMESRLGSLIGVDGPLYAVRKSEYVPLRPNIISDLMTPLLVLCGGKKVILEPEAVVEEQPTRKGRHEFNTRRRVTLRGLIGIFAHPEVLDIRRRPLLCLQVLLHKVIRWSVGPLVLINGISVVLLASQEVLFAWVLAGYLVFCLAALAGWLADRRGKKIRLCTVPYYFCLVNLAAGLAVVDFLRKKQSVTWETVRG
jgi:glycosyltransferase involved in cell wall biosynthesis